MARGSWRFWMAAAGWGGLCLSTAMAARKVQHFMVSDPQFTLSSERRGALTVDGVVYSSRSRIAGVFAPDFGRSIFQMPLDERRRRLLAIDWVEDASVSRIWPDRILVRIKERAPVAFVNLPLVPYSRAARVALIDAQGVFLDQPAQARFSFAVLSGVSEQQPESARRMRVRAMQRLLDELGPLAKDVSEVNAEAIDNLKITVQLGGRALELVLGDGNYARRYRNFLNHYPEIRKRTERVTAFDLRLDDRITTMERE